MKPSEPSGEPVSPAAQIDTALPDLLDSLAAIGRSMQEEFDPQRFLGEFSARLQRLVPHDRLVVDLLDEDGRTFTVFAEHTPAALTLHQEHYTTAFHPGTRYVVAEWVLHRVFAGEALLVGDFPGDPRFEGLNPFERRLQEVGIRSGLLVSLESGGRTIGALVATALASHAYGARHLEALSRVAGLIGPFIENVVRRQRERRRRRALEGLTAALGAGLDVRGIFGRLVDALRPVLDFEVVGVALLSRSGRELETLAEMDERYGFDHIIGRSPVLREVLARSAKVAPTEATVLLTGESGTGKELVARAVHHASLRADGPFVAINCAALPDTLLESELFGHERGAFTGADRQKPGRFELAGGGTLFLDEIGELSPAVQAKLLRVLQEREFQRVGGTTTLKADVRLIAATNRELTREVSAGRFRDDLYYRLNVFSIHVPALRERGEDVLLLADYFVQTIGARMAKADLGLSKDAREALLHHRWPGNIRELQHAVERALIVSDGGLLTAANFGIGSPVSAVPSESRPAAPISPLPQDSLPDMERRMILEAPEKARGSRVRAAVLLGLTRSQLYTRLKRHGIASSGC